MPNALDPCDAAAQLLVLARRGPAQASITHSAELTPNLLKRESDISPPRQQIRRRQYPLDGYPLLIRIPVK
jgi:hypothetical protein